MVNKAYYPKNQPVRIRALRTHPPDGVLQVYLDRRKPEGRGKYIRGADHLRPLVYVLLDGDTEYGVYYTDEIEAVDYLPAPDPFKPTCPKHPDAGVGASLADGILAGLCNACGRWLIAKHPTTGVLVPLEGAPPWSVRTPRAQVKVTHTKDGMNLGSPEKGTLVAQRLVGGSLSLHIHFTDGTATVINMDEEALHAVLADPQRSTRA